MLHYNDFNTSVGATIMSYDLRIYTSKKQKYDDLRDVFDIEFNHGEMILHLDNAQILVSGEQVLLEKDIPDEINAQLPGLKFMIECSLEPITADKEKITLLIKLAKQIARNGHGVIEDPQTNETIVPSGIKRKMKIEKTERFSVIELSWWFNHNAFQKQENLERLLSVLQNTLPESLPRRYGLCEPPQEKYSSKEAFVAFYMAKRQEGIVWYPAQPVVDVSLRIPDQIGPTRLGYRFGHFSLQIDSAVLGMPGWKTAIDRLFKNLSLTLDPFYGDIRILNNLIRGRTGAWFDSQTESHPIASWWWNGVPRKPGIRIVLGQPLLDYIKIRRIHERLENGSILIMQSNDKDDVYRGIKIPYGIRQPRIFSKAKTIGFTGRYPKFWPFAGPRRTEGK